MTDFADEASRAEELQREEALSRLRPRSALPENATGECADCGLMVEPLRLAALPHAQRCIDCQRIHEGRRQ